MNASTRLKVVNVTDTAAFAGQERQVLHLVRRLDPKKYDASVVCLGEAGELAFKLQHAGATLHSIDLRAPFRRQPRRARLFAFFRLLRLLRDIDPDIVHDWDGVSATYSRFAARMSGAPIIVGSYRRHRPPGSRAGSLERRAASLADAIVAPAPPLAEEAGRRLGLAAERLAVVPTCIDPSELLRAERAPEFLEPRFRVLALTRLEPGRGVETLIDAAALLMGEFPDLEWLVAGGGAEPIPFVRRAQRAGVHDRVRLLGEQPGPGALLRSAEIFVAPDPSAGLPAGLLEALAAGLPCVATRTPTLAASFESGRDLLLVESSDPAAIASAVRALLAEPGELSRLAAGARLAAARFPPQAPIIAYHDLYDRLVASARSRGRSARSAPARAREAGGGS